jgi:iron only hydrogenase large subunit-like protein
MKLEAVARELGIEVEGREMKDIATDLYNELERTYTQVEGEIDCVLTFSELRLMIDEEGLTSRGLAAAEFDPPWSGKGALFPVSRGMLQAADIREDLVRGEVVAADGRIAFQDAIREFESGDLDARLLEVLCCTGCVMGPGMTSSAPLSARRARSSRRPLASLPSARTPLWDQD